MARPVSTLQVMDSSPSRPVARSVISALPGSSRYRDFKGRLHRSQLVGVHLGTPNPGELLEGHNVARVAKMSSAGSP